MGKQLPSSMEERTPTKGMSARLLKRIAFMEVHEMDDGNRFLSDFNLVERVFLLLASSPPPGRCGSTLGNDDTSVSMRPRIEV